MALAGLVVESDGMTGSAVGGKSDGAGRPQSSGPVGTDIGSDEEHCVFPGPLALLDSASTASLALCEFRVADFFSFLKK